MASSLSRPHRARLIHVCMILLPLASLLSVASPGSAAPEQNLLRNPGFDQSAPWGAPQKQALEDHGASVLSERFPVSWSATTHGKDLADASVGYGTSEDGPEWAHSTVRIDNRDTEQPIAFYQPAMIPLETVTGGGYCEARVRARGSGTIALGVFEYSTEYKTKGTGAYSGNAVWRTISLTDSWQLFRTGPFQYEPGEDVGAVCFRMDIQGEVEIAEAFFGHVPPVDRDAQVTFWLPFEGSMQAGYARGTAVPYENAFANEYVDGVAGLAGRFERKPGPHPTEGWYQFAIGASYFDEQNVPRDEGTVELWFRPHREILTCPAWRTYYLWSVDRTRGPALYMQTNDEGALTLNYTETVTSFVHPSGERMSEPQTTSYDLPTDDTFLDTWHHVAFTYDTDSRAVYLDGRRVIGMDAPKAPCMTREDLNVGWAGRWGPFTPCSDLDEFRVYDRVRYLDEFTPENPTDAGAASTAPNGAPPAELPALALDGPPRVDGDRLLVPLTAGGDRFEASVELADGLPYIVSSKGILLGLKDLVEEDPPIAALPWADAKSAGASTVKARLERYDVSVTCGFALQGDRVRMSMDLAHNGEWRAPLEVRLRLRRRGGADWTGAFDGTCSRAIAEPFLPFHAEGLANIFPVSAAWGDGPGLAAAFAPDTMLSYLRQGMVSADEMEVASRTVLDPGQSTEFSLDMYTFDPRYGGDDAVARYHRRYPETFSPDPRVDPRVYTASANGMISTMFWMPYTHKPEKVPIFSAQELCRRVNAGWEWFYGTGTSAGNWSIEPFLLEALPEYAGKFGRGADPAQQKQWRLNKFEGMENRGIATGFYILTWMERRYARYFDDSLIGALDTNDASPYIDNWWTRGMRDYIFMPSWSRAGDFMRRQVDDILRENPPLAAFCYDVAERDHRDRADRPDAAGVRGFDEEGAFTAHLAAMGQLCDYIRHQKTVTGRTPGIIGNPHAWLTAFPALFRMDSAIFEGRPFELASNEYLLRQDNRFFGAKPRCTYQSGGSDLMGNYYPNVETMDAADVRFDFIALRMQCFLRCFLNNMWSCPGMVYGVREIALGQHDLARTLECGYRFVPAASVNTPLRLARYGEPSRGVFAVVNPTTGPVESPLRVDCDYLGAVPILATAGEGTLVSRGNGRELTVPSVQMRGLDYLLLDSIASLEGLPAGTDVDIEARLEQTASSRTLRIMLRGEAPDSIALRIGIQPDEVVSDLRVDGEPVKGPGAGATVLVPAIKLDGEATIRCRLTDSRWLSPATDVTAFAFTEASGAAAQITYGDEALVHEARRVAEYFKFWTRNTDGYEPVNPECVLAEGGTPSPEGPMVRLSLRPPDGRDESEGILRDGESLSVWAPDAERLRELVNMLFAALDEVYPYVGVIGNQNIVSNYDDCSTSEQRKLLHHAELPGNAFSVQELLAEREG